MIEVNHLSFSYDKEAIIEDVSFCAKPGKITAVLGANGAGKTTLLKCIAGHEKRVNEIVVCGQKQSEMKQRDLSSLISYLDQSTECSAQLNVFEIILLGRILHLSFKVSDHDIVLVNEIMDTMSIREFANRQIGELSGGQRQLVFIAQALIRNPKILILDEPTSALDSYNQYRIMDFLKQVTRKQNLTTLVTLHHLDIAAKYADRVVVIDNKRIYAENAPQDAFTIEMMRDIYKVKAEIFTDSNGQKHIVTTESI